VGEPPTETTPEQLHLLAGRLVFAFQKLELVLKGLSPLIRQESWVSELQAKLAKQEVKLARSTLGGVIASLADAMTPPTPPEEIGDKPSSRDMHIGFHVSFDTMIDDPELVKLGELVAERNWFVHHCLVTDRPVDATSRTALAVKLEALLFRVEERVRYFLERYKIIREGTQNLLRLLKENPDWLDHGKFFDQQVAAKLAEIAGELGDSEGWTPLSRAEQILNSEMPDLRKESAVHLEASTLSEHIRKLGIFELRPVGPGCHACYRIKPLSPSEPSNGA
jgi:hypothetical protein